MSTTKAGTPIAIPDSAIVKINLYNNIKVFIQYIDLYKYTFITY